MSLFPIHFRAGIPVYEQVLYAARKAIISGDLKPGDLFPSVRALSAEYKINPNTVQKAMVALRAEGLIESLPGIGNRVAEVPEASAMERRALAMVKEGEALILASQAPGFAGLHVEHAFPAEFLSENCPKVLQADV